MSALAYLKQLPETKEQITLFTTKAINEILSGVHNPLSVDVMLKAMEETIKIIRKNAEVKEYILAEVNRYGEKSFDFGTARITKKDAVTYKYDHCSKWVELKSQLQELEATMKSIKTPVADTETGLIIDPAIKKSTETYSITLK
jgi:hypothetical protein